MEDEDKITIQLPFLKRLTGPQLLILAVFTIFMIFLIDWLKFVITTQSKDATLAAALVIATLILIGLVAIYLIRSLARKID